MFYARAIFPSSHEATTARFYTKCERDAFVAQKVHFSAISAADARKDVAGRVNHRVLLLQGDEGSYSRWVRV